jgi:nucleoside-diphosphate-sugar epimerase
LDKIFEKLIALEESNQLQTTQNLVKFMKQDVILGCGYVGLAWAKLRGTSGLTVTTTSPDRLSELSPLADRVVVIQGNDTAGLKTLLAETDRLVICVGAQRGVTYTESYLTTAQTIATIVPQLPRLQQLVYTSSASVYGDYAGAWVTETNPLQPATENTQVLAETEAIYLSLNSAAVAATVLRLSGIYGPGRSLDRIFSRAAGTTRPGDGQAPANWVHRDDIAAAIDWVLTHNLSGLYNVTNDEPPTQQQILDWVCQQYQLAPVTWDPSQPSPRNYNARVSNDKLKRTGFQFQHRSVMTEP